MGDHRVTIKIDFEMHGHKKTWDAWLNWSDSVPGDAARFISDQAEIALEKWDFEEAFPERTTKKEKRERELFEKLKQKYEPDTENK